MARPISPMETARARRDFGVYFDKTVDIFNPSNGRTSSGGTVQTYPATPSRTVRGYIAPMGGEDTAYYAEKLGSRMGWVLGLPASTLVRLDARLKIGTRTFEVMGTDDVRSDQWTVRVMVRENL